MKKVSYKRKDKLIKLYRLVRTELLDGRIINKKVYLFPKDVSIKAFVQDSVTSIGTEMKKTRPSRACLFFCGESLPPECPAAGGKRPAAENQHHRRGGSLRSPVRRPLSRRMPALRPGFRRGAAAAAAAGEAAGGYPRLRGQRIRPAVSWRVPGMRRENIHIIRRAKRKGRKQI